MPRLKSGQGKVFFIEIKSSGLSESHWGAQSSNKSGLVVWYKGFKCSSKEELTKEFKS